MGYIRGYAERMNLAAATPQGKLSSTGHALANTNATNPEFLIYAPSGGKLTVNLSGSSDRFAVEWMNPATGVKTAGEEVSGGATRIFSPPFHGDAVLYLRK
jgi:Putative collagen-binding domain of a collagenase